MRKFLFLLVLQSIALLFLSATVFSQDCKPPEIVFNKNADNIFSEEQETILGDVMAEQVQKDYRIIGDAEVNSLVREIGEKITKHLPPTGIKFKFYVVDLPEINAFITAGGRVYVTRKLIAFVRSEDELAGILAHELGHGTVRHGAIDMSRYFKKILGVDSVGDRKDIFEKYNRLIDLSRTKRVRTSNSHEDNQQLEADKIGVFAMTAAGYNPSAFSSAFDRLAGTEGKTGSWFSDLVGATSPSQKRLGEIIKAVETLPAACQDKNSVATASEFEKWQTAVINYSGFLGKENIGEVFRRNDLSPDLRDDLNQLKFSQNGKYILAQDDSGIFVLSREPFKVLFRIEAPEAKPAKFSPDSQSIVFDTETMRVERWNIAAQKPDSIKEIFLREDCFQTALSDDGKMFACFSLAQGLEIKAKLINVETNETLLEKEKFYRPDPYEFIQFLNFSFANSDSNGLELFQTEFSPDGRYFVAGRVLRLSSRNFSLTTGITGRATVNAGNEGILGFDMVKKEEMKLGSDLRKIIASPFAFYSNDQIIGQNSDDPDKSGIYSFPSGKQIERFTLSGDSITKVHKGNYILVRPLKVAPVGVFDLDQKKFLIANNTPAFDAYDNVIVSENKTGVLGLYRLDKDEVVAEINLPESYFGNLRTVTVSPDLNWVAVSDKSRGAVWSLYSGKQTFYVQGFRGAYFDKSGKIYADFARTEKTPRQIAVMDIGSKEMGAGREVERPNTRQYGKFLFTTIGEDKPKKKKDDDKTEKPSYMIENPDDYQVREKGTIEVRDVVSDEMLWSRKFPDEMPSRFFNPTKETMAFIWRLKSSSAKSIVKNDENLKKMSSAMGDKDGDYLVQVVEAATGNVVGQTLIETGEGSFGIRRASADGDWLAVTDTENRILFYSLADGTLKHRFFGGDVTISSETNLAAVENFAGQISIYDLIKGEKINELNFKTPVITAQFDKYGKKLFVLTADQEAIIFDTAKFAKAIN